MRPRFFMALAFGLSLPSAAFAQTVVLTPTSDGIEAEYRLDARSERTAFTQTETIRTDWAVLGTDIALTPEAVVSKTATDRVVLQIAPDSTEEGRGYIALTRLGEGYVLYPPALTVHGQMLRLEANVPEGWTLLPEGPFDGYVYLGPTTAIERSKVGTVRISSETKRSAASVALFDTFDRAVVFFTQTFGPLPRAPVLSVTQQGAGPVPFRGDVTDSGMISIRFHGEVADALDADALAQVEHFAWHETAHLWNSHLARPIEDSPWLHEGGAEYLGLVGAASAGRIDQTQVLAGLSQRLTDCRNAVATRPDIAARIGTGSAVYACGTVIQWVADMELRQSGGRPMGIIAVWKDFIDRARHGQADYGPADLKARLGPDSAVAAMLDGPADTRWSDLERALEKLEVRWVNRPSDASLMAAALRHLKRQACPGGLSFAVRNGSIEMDNGADCGSLAGTVTLASVEGHDPFGGARAMFEAVQTGCAHREPLAVVLRGSEATITIPCTANLVTPSAYALTQAPLIALPVTP